MADNRRALESCDALRNAVWSCCSSPAGVVSDAAALSGHDAFWLPTEIPGTAALAIRANGKWDFQHPVDVDADDWWFRTRFAAPARAEDELCRLCFDGLAGIAEVWLNGTHLLSSTNMFVSHRSDVAGLLQVENELVIGFRSLNAEMKKRRPRPRWKTNLVSNQQLRWQRVSLLGRVPGWSPSAAAVGPWRPIHMERGRVLLSEVRRTAKLEDHTGVVSFSCVVSSTVPVKSARLCVGDAETVLECSEESGALTLAGGLRIAQPELWWPHTHGESHLMDCSLLVETAEEIHHFQLQRVGFRALEVRSEPSFAINVNGVPVYCRGACWTTGDIFNPHASKDVLRRDLTLARDAGMNMVRIGGTMNYESDVFYRICDELGILVWQDFMFANMDYPVDDGVFSRSIEEEAKQQLDRLAQHPCIAIYCGGSEIEQQAAMLGMPRELWRNRWFGERLPALCDARHPGTFYLSATPTGGVLPFHVGTGVTHYYGVGAYLRDIRELRQANVKFTSECLGFSNIPEPDVIDEIMGGAMPVMHHPRWKQRVPRDTGAGWDFEDVRDHYLKVLFDVDPVALRSFDVPRYLELGRLAPGEMMVKAFSEWRSGHSQNAGALVWFFKDLWAAAGWGIVDHRGYPKAAYYQLKRVWQPRQIVMTDEGLDGLHVHLINETNEAVDGVLEILLLREPDMVMTRHEVTMIMSPRSRETRSVDEILGSFHDVNYAYRFGPPKHHAVVATWFNLQRGVISEAFHLTRHRDPEPRVLSADSLRTTAEKLSNGQYRVTIGCDHFLDNVRLSAKGYRPDDNYFHLVPGRSKQVVFQPFGPPRDSFSAYLEALNVMGEMAIENSEPSG